MKKFKNTKAYFDYILENQKHCKIHPQRAVLKIENGNMRDFYLTAKEYLNEGKIEKYFEVVCTLCRTEYGPFKSLKEIPEHFTCHECLQKFDADESSILLFYVPVFSSDKQQMKCIDLSLTQ